jgi:hypothetical protein
MIWIAKHVCSCEQSTQWMELGVDQLEGWLTWNGFGMEMNGRGRQPI